MKRTVGLAVLLLWWTTAAHAQFGVTGVIGVMPSMT